MALPDSYTDDTFRDYLHAQLNLGGFADDLGWSVADGQYTEILNDALALYGATDVTTISGVSALRALRIAGRLALWEAVAGATAHYRDSRTVDGAQSALSQVHAQAVAQLERARTDAAAVPLAGLSLYPPVTVGRVRYKDDPYFIWDDS